MTDLNKRLNKWMIPFLLIVGFLTHVLERGHGWVWYQWVFMVFVGFGVWCFAKAAFYATYRDGD